MYHRVVALIACCVASTCIAQSQPSTQVELVAVGRLSGQALDLSGLTGTLETDTPTNQLGGFSAIEYSGQANRYIVLSDRGPGDGAASFPCRFHEFELSIDVQNKSIVPQLRKTTLLKSALGQQLTGSLKAVDSSPNEAESIAFDCEGIRQFDSKSFAISDEYGPSVRLFDASGKQFDHWGLPSAFRLCANSNEKGAMGTFPNRGLEGLARSRDGGQLIAAMQGALVQDGVVEGEKCLGLNTRWLVIDSQNKRAGRTKQLVYPLTDESTGVSEVLAVDAHRYLVIERDSNAGNDAKFKHIYLADTQGATDVSSIASLPRTQLPESVKPISKSLLIDLRDDRFGLGGEATAEKPEGLCWGPDLPDGRRLLVVCVDNDFEVDRQSEFYAFAISL
ncbi:MAG: esterase-like activity of phytase family protein [Pirellulaceae bacterium]|nr:esterase-like activity of phytase family protein [Pirellulaceae bacterium]